MKPAAPTTASLEPAEPTSDNPRPTTSIEEARPETDTTSYTPVLATTDLRPTLGSGENE